MFKIQLNEHQRFIKNTLFLGVSSVFSALVNILVISHLSHALLVDRFGTYNFLLTYSSYFLLLTSLGTDVVAIRRIAADKHRVHEIYGALVPLKLILSLSVFIVMLLPMLVNETFRAYGWVLVIFSSIVFTSPFSAQCVFEAFKRLEISSIVTIFSQAVYLVLVVLYVKKPEDLIIAALIIVFKNSMVAFSQTLIYIRLFKRYRWNYDRDVWRMLIKSGLVIGLIQVSVMLLHYLDVFMLNFMKSETAVGLYSAAYRAMFMILTMIAIVNNLMNTLLFENYGSDMNAFAHRFKEYAKLSTLLGFGISVGAILLAEPYLDLFYDMRLYNESVVCFRILMVSFLFMMICIPMHSGMLAAHKDMLILKIVLSQVAGNIIGNWFLIPAYGITGSAFSTVLSIVMGFILYLVFFRRILRVNACKNILVGALSVIPMAFYLSIASDETHFLIKSLIGAVIMAATVIAFKVYTLDELKSLKKNLLTFRS